MKIWWYPGDSFRYYLHDEYDEIRHLGAIKLTEAEWKDYQRVEEEHEAWQERIEVLTGPPSGLASPNLSRSVIEWLIAVTEASLEVGLLDERQRPPVKRK